MTKGREEKKEKPNHKGTKGTKKRRKKKGLLAPRHWTSNVPTF